MIKPTKTVKKNQIQSKSIDLNIFPSAGPNASISGMKKLFWGKDAYVLKVGIYIYKVTEEIYNKF